MGEGARGRGHPSGLPKQGIGTSPADFPKRDPISNKSPKRLTVHLPFPLSPIPKPGTTTEGSSGAACRSFVQSHPTADPEPATAFCIEQRCKMESGSSSVVEHQLPKLKAAGSIPVSRSTSFSL